MIIYFIVGFKTMKVVSAKPVFADSFYYLGFLFTFTSLLVAISEANQNLSTVINQMGTALSTTVLGMLIRILISHFDTIETVNTAVSDEMANMSTQIRRLTEQLTNLLKINLML